MGKMIVISQDAMVWDDLEYLLRQPHFAEAAPQMAAVRTLRTIYPTVTYPVHVSIATGQYPDRHGVVSNEEFTPGVLAPPWHWFARAHHSPTVFAAAKAAGLSTAAVFWPVTGSDPHIDYLVAEYWSQHPGDDLYDVFARSGSSPAVMEQAVEKNFPLLRGVERKHPQADEFVNACACDIIRNFRPDLLMIHPAAIDGLRHKYGLFNPYVTATLDDTDRWLGDIIQATKDAGVYEDTDFVILSDHGQMESRRVIHLNVLLWERGLLRADADGNLTDWDAYVASAGMSAHVYLKDPGNREVYGRVENLLREWCEEGIYGFSEVFTTEEIRQKERLAGNFSFVLETDGYTAFGQDWRRPLVRPMDNSDYRYGRATHGYLPDKGPQPTLFAWGPSFAPGAAAERRPIVDVAPTMAKILGFSLPEADGEPILEILR